MRHLALDFGTKRIGLALSDAGGSFSQPHDVLANTPDALQKIAKICTDEGVQKLVVGLPLHMDGQPSWMTRASLDFGSKLAAATRLPLVYVDERLSSFAAEQGLIDRKRSGEHLTRQDKKSRLDALSAAHFLRDYLEGRLPPLDPPATPSSNPSTAP